VNCPKWTDRRTKDGLVEGRQHYLLNCYTVMQRSSTGDKALETSSLGTLPGRPEFRSSDRAWVQQCRDFELRPGGANNWKPSKMTALRK